MSENETRIKVEELRPYFRVLACMVAADHVVADEEAQQFSEFLEQHKVPPEIATECMGFLVEPQDPLPMLNELKGSAIRFSLYLDAIALAWADRNVSQSERDLLVAFAGGLGLEGDEAEVLEEFFLAAREAVNADGDDQERAATRLSAAVRRAKSLGVPILAIATSGEIAGLSSAILVSGLSTIGLGLTSLTGIGAAAVLGYGGFHAIKWVLNRNWRRA